MVPGQEAFGEDIEIGGTQMTTARKRICWSIIAAGALASSLASPERALAETMEEVRPIEIARPQPASEASEMVSEKTEEVKPAVAKPEPDLPKIEEGLDPTENARAYCTNIADAAADARYALQAAALEDLETQVNARIDALEKKRAQYEEWLALREEFLRKADESIVAIFTQMRPDAASQQMSVMDLEAAAAILVKLNPRIASAILNEMDPMKAAQLTTTMAGLAKPSDEAKTSG